MDNPREKSFVIHQQQVQARGLPPALYVVATPIGNLADITLRALETLAAADVLACEDTRVTRVLLERYGIRQRPIAYHEHNAAEAGPRLVAAIQSGRSVALVSDAGTPLVSDPGYRLVQQVLEADLTVVPIPGASAVIGALASSGLPTDTFLFAGFLPVKAGQKRTRIAALKAVPGTLVFYESPRRLSDTLAMLFDVLGPRDAAIAREMTKTFEEFRRGRLDDLARAYAQEDTPRGEIVICVGPPIDEPVSDRAVDELLVRLLITLPPSKAAAQAARETGLPKSELYRRLTALKAP